MSEYFIARQPIFDRSLKLYAYELLFRRSAEANMAPTEFDGDAATAEVLSAGAEIGIQQLVGNNLAFINLPARFLEEPELMPLASESLVLEVLESVEFNDRVMAGMDHYKQQGYTLALDDFIYDEAADPALMLADLVKLDIQLIDPSEWPEAIQRLKARGLKVLAEKVETEDDFIRLMDLGCDYFQGYFFAKPRVVPGKRIGTDKVTLLNLVSSINNPDTTPEQLAELVSREVTLSVRALSYVNSAAMGLRRQVDSIQQAIILLGRDKIRHWVTLYLMFSANNKPSELITLAVVRGKFCELLADDLCDDSPDVFFTAGLLSALDALMDAPIDEALSHMTLSDEMRAALLRREGTLGQALNMAIALERGEHSYSDDFGLTPERISGLHIEAMLWADASVATVG